MHLQTNTEAWEARKKKEYLDCRHEVTKVLGVGSVGLPDFPQPATFI